MKERPSDTFVVVAHDDTPEQNAGGVQAQILFYGDDREHGLAVPITVIRSFNRIRTSEQGMEHFFRPYLKKEAALAGLTPVLDRLGRTESAHVLVNTKGGLQIESKNIEAVAALVRGNAGRVRTYGTNFVMSVGGDAWATGDERLLLPSSFVLWHAAHEGRTNEIPPDALEEHKQELPAFLLRHVIAERRTEVQQILSAHDFSQDFIRSGRRLGKWGVATTVGCVKDLQERFRESFGREASMARFAQDPVSRFFAFSEVEQNVLTMEGERVKLHLLNGRPELDPAQSDPRDIPYLTRRVRMLIEDLL